MPLPLGFPGSEDDPFAAAAARTRQAVRPEGGRPEGFGTFMAENFPRHVLEGLLSLPQRATQAAGELQRQGDVYDPGPALEAATMTMGATPFGAPRGAMGAGPIKAYHGSPHDFGRFDLSKIGTGEGAQVYGHGLYFAENPKTAQSYRDALKDRYFASNAGPVRYGDAFSELQNSVQGMHPDHTYQLAKTVYDKLERGAPLDDIAYPVKAFNDAYYKMVETAQKRGFKATPGRMYEVNINADPAQFLDWDKALTGQSPHVQEALTSVVKKQAPWLESVPNAKGENLYYFPNFVERAKNSQALNDAGIPGIKYLDQGSRMNPAALPNTPMANEARQFLEAAKNDPTAALQLFRDSNPVARYGAPERDEIQRIIKAAANQPTSNYVLFRDDIIDILRKYGLAGLAPAAGAAATAGHEAPLPMSIPQSQ